MHIGLIVDHPKRDLPGAVRIAQVAASRGHCATLIPLYEQALDVPLLGLDALVVNYARSTNFDLLKAYAKVGIALFVLDTEGGILADKGANSPFGLAQTIRDKGFAPYLTGYFFWGPQLRDAFVQTKAFPQERLFVTGCPRFDFASERWRTALPYPKRDYVLINANFPLVNPRFATSIDTERQTMVNVGWDPAYVDGLISDLRVVHKNYIQAIADLAVQLPNVEFLIRPHPFENAQVYVDHYQHLANVQVDGQGSVLNVIASSRCVLHLNCGTATEAVMMGKLPISLEFLNTPRLLKHSSLPSTISWHGHSIQEIAHAITHIRETTEAFDFKQRYMQHIYPWFFQNDGSAGERVIDAIESVLSTKTEAARTMTTLSKVAHSLRASRADPRLGQRAQAVMANLLGSQAVSRLRTRFKSQRRDKQFNDWDIQSWLDLMTHAGTSDTVTIQSARHPIHKAALASISVLPKLNAQ